jgi:hypothetical protein
MTVDNRAVSRDEPVITTSRSPLHRAAGTGAMYLGPGDVYRFPAPAGIEKFFEETLQRTLDTTADIPDNVDAIAARYAAAAPRYGMEFSSTAILAPRSPEP